MLRLGTWAAVLLAMTALPASARIQRVLLVPLDDRPAAAQFAQMIGDMADVRVDTPPVELLGRFTQPGRPKELIEWLHENLAEYDAAIVNTDMVLYGGLIASRADRTSQNLARQRLDAFCAAVRSNQKVKVYGFSTVMRLAPTATASIRQWRLDLARFAELRETYRVSGDRNLLKTLNNLRARIPKGEIERYDGIRNRNHQLQQDLLNVCDGSVFDFMMFGQDDAQPNGPHVRETFALKASASKLNVRGATFFASGIDQISNVLLSRALTEDEGWNPRIRIVFADDQGRTKVAAYESAPVDQSLRDQIEGSGAVAAGQSDSFDYTLYVNTPDPRNFALDAFLGSLKTEVDQGMPVAIADINLGKSGTGDERLFGALMEQGRSSRVLAYAGWNTAGNTMGTTIPAANVYLLARKQNVEPLHRETALRAFILHRLVNDFEYHKYVRPQAYAMIDSMPKASREETYGADLAKVDGLVKEGLGQRLTKRFEEQLLGTRFYVGTKQYEVSGLENVKIELPWPRAYEVRLSFNLDIRDVDSMTDLSGMPVLPLGDRTEPIKK